MSVEMIQLGSREEWLKHRDRIGGSDASAILGMNPYRTKVTKRVLTVKLLEKSVL